MKLLSDKRTYFSIFGAIGGLISAFIYIGLGFDSAFSSWILGTGFDGMCIATLLAFGQTKYVGKSFDKKAIGRAALIGAFGGFIGGGIAFLVGLPIVSLLGGGTDAGRFLGWAIGGIVIGFAVSKVIPNLKSSIASLAGGVGGFLGCFLMYLISSYSLGVATTGAAIGLAIALFETAFRQVWLEITIRPKGFSLEKERTVSVSLGDKPIVFGCAHDSDVKLAEVEGAQAHFAKVSLVKGKAVLFNIVTNKTSDLDYNEEFDVSNAHIVVRSKTATVNIT
ncbi:hypothetical protein [Chromatium okenii]|jgi:hypothetical protein|uniref:Uncharacterized protein n=1 Tax=Chromatium okenii TaxID=61644 RepID=A0A2S7XMB5_9GAMM|nr:hypothetical protein [Chromatium okenii]MBV5310588.1 hypothetical protein [Chromatium okenii]PQJ94879.1 hypothetical protein CXB77_17215 [Chromatium okenii]